MSIYRRPQVTGALVFFTVTLAARGGDVLVREVGLLREAVRVTRAERPFGIEAWVVLPDHIHAVWQMPPGDRAYGVRWGAIKARFTRAVRGKYAVDVVEGRPGFSPAMPAMPAMSAYTYPTGSPGRSVGTVCRAEARPTARQAGAGRVATPVLGTPYPGRGGVLGACPVLLDEPGETRVRRAAGGLAVFLGASGRAICAGDGSGDVGWGFSPRGYAIGCGGWWVGTPPAGCCYLFIMAS